MQILHRERTSFIADTDVWHVHSDSVGAPFRVTVSGPIVPVQHGQRLPVFVGLDGDITAGANVGTVRAMALSGAGEAPLSFVINVGYPLDSGASPFVLRNRDLSPTPLPLWDRLSGGVFGDTVIASGGGEAFLRFLVDELLPALSAAYPIDLQRATLSGSSLAGLFAAFALISAPHAFANFLIVSPAVWWDQRMILRCTPHPDLHASGASKRVALVYGEYEEKEKLHLALANINDDMAATIKEIKTLTGPLDMVGDVDALKRRIETLAPGLSVSVDVVAKATHTSVYGAALSLGVRRLSGAL